MIAFIVAIGIVCVVTGWALTALAGKADDEMAEMYDEEAQERDG